MPQPALPHNRPPTKHKSLPGSESTFKPRRGSWSLSPSRRATLTTQAAGPEAAQRAPTPAQRRHASLHRKLSSPSTTHAPRDRRQAAARASAPAQRQASLANPGGSRNRERHARAVRRSPLAGSHNSSRRGDGCWCAGGSDAGCAQLLGLTTAPSAPHRNGPTPRRGKLTLGEAAAPEMVAAATAASPAAAC